MTDAVATASTGAAAASTGADAAATSTTTAAATDTQQTSTQSAATTQTEATKTEATKTEASPYTAVKGPEGFDAAGLPGLLATAAKYGLSAEAAQKLVNDAHTGQTKYKADQLAAQTKRDAEWKATILADKEYGGDKTQASIDRARNVVDKINEKIAPGIKALLEEAGHGSHPAVVRLMNYLGQNSREDVFVGTGSQSNDEPSLAKSLYGPTMNPSA